MSLLSNHVGLSNGSVAGKSNVPQVQPAEALATSGLIPRTTPHLLPSQPAAAGKGVVGAFAKICQRWRLSRADQVVLLGYKGSEFFGEQLLDGNLLSPPQDVLERAGYVLAISVGLGSLFDDAEEAELAWLNTPRDDLRGRSPLAYMLEGRMTNVIEVALSVNRERGM
jgi:Protein of unknown function (DUF2384)